MTSVCNPTRCPAYEAFDGAADWDDIRTALRDAMEAQGASWADCVLVAGVEGPLGEAMAVYDPGTDYEELKGLVEADESPMTKAENIMLRSRSTSVTFEERVLCARLALGIANLAAEAGDL